MILTIDNLEDLVQRNSHWWPVGILPEQAHWIEQMAAKRNQNGKSRGWKSKTSTTDNSWHVSGMAGEWAASRIYNVPIGAITIDQLGLGQSDLGSFIEVKSRREPESSRWDLAVNRDQLKLDRAYVLCLTCLYPSYVVCIGWAWGSEVKKEGRSYRHSGTGHDLIVMDYKKTRPPISLFDELRAIGES